MANQINTLVAVYKSHDIRDASDDFGTKFLISHAGKVLADRDSVEAAREYIDQKIEREKGEGLALADYFDKAVEEINSRPAPVSKNADRFARNMKLMGRHENNPDDLI